MNDKIIDFNNIKRLRKYMTVPVLLDILKKKRISLLKPDSWEDRNDSKIMNRFKILKEKQTVLASCFTYGEESIYHWNAFSKNDAGCMLELQGQQFIKHVSKNYPELLIGKIQYLSVKKLNKETFMVDEIPFTKRIAYKCENEFRIVGIFDDDLKNYDIEFDLSFVTKIKLSQRMPPCVGESIKEMISSMGISRKNVNMTTILEYKRWVDFFEKYEV